MIVALDSNILIAGLSLSEAHSVTAQKLVHDIIAGRHQAAASSIIYTEVLRAEQGSGFESDLVEYIGLIDNLTTLPADNQICTQAGLLRIKYGRTLKIPDALHLATALVAGADVFITNDKALAKVAGKILPTKELSDWR